MLRLGGFHGFGKFEFRSPCLANLARTKMLSIVTIMSVIVSASSPSKRSATGDQESELKVYDVLNPGTFNLLHEWLSDYDLLMHTLSRLLSHELNRGSKEAQRLVASIKALQSVYSVSAVAETMLAVRQGPVQEFLSKTYRKGNWQRSFFIDAKENSPAFKHSELAEGLQVLRDYIGLVTNPAMPLAEFLPPMFREPVAYSQLVVPDDSIPKWKKLSLLEAGATLSEARKAVADPLKRIKSFLFAPKFFEVLETSLMNFSEQRRPQRIQGRIISAGCSIADVITGRVARLRENVTLLPEVGAVLIRDTEPDGRKTCTIHWHTRTDVIDIAEGLLLAGVVIMKQTGHIMLLLKQLDDRYVRQQFHEDPTAGYVDFNEMAVRHAEQTCSQHLINDIPGLTIQRMGHKSREILEVIWVQWTDTFLVVDTVTSTIYHEFKAQMKDFQPQSLLDAYQKAPGTSEMQQALATAFFTTDSSLALAIIRNQTRGPLLSSAGISQMYRDAFP